MSPGDADVGIRVIMPRDCEVVEREWGHGFLIKNTHDLAIAVLILSMKNYLPTQPPLLLR